MNVLMEDCERTPYLVVDAQRGDREAFDRLVRKFEGRLRASIESWTKYQLGPRVDVEDVVQGTWLRASRSLERFEWQGDDSFLRWLCGIAKRVLADAIREQRKHAAAGSAPNAADEGSTQTAHLRRTERFDRLEAALGELSSEHREVLLLARVEGLQAKEIAARMKRSPNAVKHLLARALRVLKERFGDTESLRLPRSRHLGERRASDAD